MKRYIRFGEIPADGRSINYFKLTFEQQNNLDYNEYPDEAKECGLSVFDIVDDMPLLDNLQLITTLHARVRDNYKAYIVSGDIVGYGNDGEPLLSNVKIVSDYIYQKEELYEYIISVLKTKYQQFEKRAENNEFMGTFSFPKKTLVCNDYEFWNPVEGFDTRLGYKK